MIKTKSAIIPPLLINNKLTSNFEVKANYFHIFLVSNHTSLNSSGKILETQFYITNTKLLYLH